MGGHDGPEYAFAVLGYMHSFLLSKAIGAVVASVVTTLPLALAVGYGCGGATYPFSYTATPAGMSARDAAESDPPVVRTSSTGG